MRESDNKRKRIRAAMITMEGRTLSGSVKDLGELQLKNVCGTEDEPLWDEMVRKHHYLGLGKIIGPRIKYLVLREGAAIAAIGFNRASKSVGVRDEYIGWDHNQRMAMLKHAVNNVRFIILPNVKVRNLASHLLSRGVKEMRAEWETRYGSKPIVVETFVDGSLHKGTCYLAANWAYLGETLGYGKVGNAFVYHGRKKKVFAYILDRKSIASIRQSSESWKKSDIPTRPTLRKKARREIAMMIEAMTDWSPTLLEDAGITESSVEGLGARLTEYLGEFGPCFARTEGRENFQIIIKGLLSDLERKSVEPIALRYAGPARVRAIQIFMGAANAVDDGALHSKYKSKLADAISEDGGMITLDGSDFPKKGKKSVGVARQYCGALGKVDNCQAGVFIGYTSEKGYGLVDRRLYMPESWMDIESAGMREECGVPDSLEFKTKVELGSEMIREASAEGLFKAKWVGADSYFGRNKDFLDGIPEGLLYFADILDNMLLYPAGGADKEPVKASKLANDEDFSWTKVILGEGAKGPIIACEKCLRVFESRGNAPGGEVWLYIRRLSDGTLKYALSDAPADTPIEELRRAATMRWPIEQCFDECKGNLGMDHYEGRSWLLWHRHMLFVFIAHLFLLETRLSLKKNSNPDAAAGSHASASGIVEEHRFDPQGAAKPELHY